MCLNLIGYVLIIGNLSLPWKTGVKYTLGSNQYSLMTFLAQAACLTLDHLYTAWSVCKIQTLKTARLRLICRWVWCLMHRNAFTLTGPLKTVWCWLCLLVGTNPSVSPRRSGPLSDRVPPLLCVTSGGLFDITTGSSLALGTMLNSFSENNQGENVGGAAAGCCVCCYFTS